jgi:hypothetical protein
LIKVLDIVIGAIIALIAAVIVVFLILLVINIALFRKLRSIIPLPPDSGPTAKRPHDSDKPQSAGRPG